MSALDPRWKTGMCSNGAGTVTFFPEAYVVFVHQYVHGSDTFESVDGRYTVHWDTFASVTGAIRSRGPNMYLEQLVRCNTCITMMEGLTVESSRSH
jgi:hypothetical protein